VLPADCLLCGAPDALGLGLCAACIEPGEETRTADQRLLFLERGEDRGHREAIADEIWSLAGDDAEGSRVEAALRGEVPLARVGAGAAERAARHLRSYGLPVRIIHPARIGRRVSTGLGLALGAAIGMGLVAGIYVAPAMLLITPTFAGVVVWAVVRRQRPALLTKERGPVLPSAATTVVRQALAEIPDGPARRLFGDIARMASSLYALYARGSARPSGPEDEGLGKSLTELLSASARLAADLAGLDESLAVMESQAGSATAEPAWIEAHTGVSRTRDRLVQRLLDALAAIGRAHAADL
jgi:hypothetical protein